MKQSKILFAGEAFIGSAVVRRFTFKAFDTRGESAHFKKLDCFECLSPYKSAV